MCPTLVPAGALVCLLALAPLGHIPVFRVYAQRGGGGTLFTSLNFDLRDFRPFAEELATICGLRRPAKLLRVLAMLSRPPGRPTVDTLSRGDEPSDSVRAWICTSRLLMYWPFSCRSADCSRAACWAFRSCDSSVALPGAQRM